MSKEKSVVLAAVKNMDLTTTLPKWTESEDFLMKKLVYNAIIENPKILECDPISVISAAREGIAAGLVPGRQFYIIPYGKKATCFYDYKGIQEFCYRSPRLQAMIVQTVDQKDSLEIEPSSGIVRHVINCDEQSGMINYAYAIAFLHGSPVPIVEYMSKVKIDEVMACAKTKSVWQKWYGEMAKKTVLKRLMKHIPQIPSLYLAAIAAEDRKELDVTYSATEGKNNIKDNNVPEADKELEKAFDHIDL